MHDDNDFLRKLLENPADDTVRLVYADWLDERGDEESETKARFLRLTARLLEPNRTGKWRKARLKEMQPLAAKLSTDWLALVSRLKLEGCKTKAKESEARGAEPTPAARLFEFVCDKRWDELALTLDNAMRRCEDCQDHVYFCETIMEARKYAEKGHCIAVDLGIIRRENDLAPRLIVLGPPSIVAIWEAEDKRLEPDAVSRERAERKGKLNENHNSTANVGDVPVIDLGPEGES